MMRGLLVLLAFTAIVVVWHSVDFKPAKPPARNLNPNLNLLFPEQKYLITGPVNINEATEADLIAIPRIGPSLAKKIIEFRSAHGPINFLDELLEVNGIGPRILESIRPYIKSETIDNGP